MMISGGNDGTITSRQNPQVRYLRSLHQKKHREQERKFLIEGWRFVEEALNSAAPVETVIFGAAARDDARYKRISDLAAGRGIPVLHMADHVLEAVMETQHPQGVAALVRQWDPDLTEVFRQSTNPLLLVVDGVRDPGNLGTVIRTADAAGVTAVALLTGTADLFNGKTLRSTMGSVFHLPVQKDVTVQEIRKLLAEHGLPLLAADISGGKTVYELSMTGPLAIAVGSEAAGLSEELKQVAAELVSIPMPGRAESLNVSVAAGVLLFEAVRQRTVIHNSTCK
ncbi:MAG: TrmH family RNA methyltransferase [Bacillota bacterium]